MKQLYHSYLIILAALLGIAPAASAQYAAAQDSLPAPHAGQPKQDSHIRDWFAKYDEVRREAQMNPVERQKADALLSKGLSIIVPGEEKIEAQNLLNSLVARNAKAANELKLLPVYPETKPLHMGYYRYFIDARALFSDYVAVQNNPFAQDNNGRALAAELMPRKQALEQLDQTNKALDAQVREQFGIAPYKY